MNASNTVRAAAVAGAAIVFFSAGIPAARANVIQDFSVAGQFTDATALSGTLGIDITAGTIVSADLTTSTPNAYHFTFIDFQETLSGGTYEAGFAQTAPGFPLIDLTFPTSLVNYQGGALCLNNGSNCVGTFVFFDTQAIFGPALATGTATLAPEPSSTALIGLSTLGLIIARRIRALKRISSACRVASLLITKG